jgi:hypothetical protein
MPARYSSRCKACNSEYRGQIEAWKVKDHLNTGQIELRLRDLGEIITRRALDNHFAKHYNVQAEALKQYQKSQAELQEAAAERVSEVQVLDDIVAGKQKLHRTIESILYGRLKDLEGSKDLAELPKLSAAYVALYTGCASGICHALKIKQEMLGEDGAGRQAKALETWVDLMMEDDNIPEQGTEKADPPKGA